MKLADCVTMRPPTDQSLFWERLGLLGNQAAFVAESRIPEYVWNAVIDATLGLADPVDNGIVKSAIQRALGSWILTGPEAQPAQGFLERVANARTAVLAQRYSGVSVDEIERDWEDLLKMVRTDELEPIRSHFGSLLIGRRPVWGTPFADLAARPFEGVGIADLCSRLALGRPPYPDGNDWVFCYSAPGSPAPRVPTMADACGGGNWHEPFFPAPVGATVGQTKPQVPGILPFSEVVHEEITWHSLSAVPEPRTV